LSHDIWVLLIGLLWGTGFGATLWDVLVTEFTSPGKPLPRIAYLLVPLMVFVGWPVCFRDLALPRTRQENSMNPELIRQVKEHDGIEE
jgi:hypothetical protein